MARAAALWVKPDEARAVGFNVNRDGRRRSLFELSAAEGTSRERLACLWPEIAAWPDHAVEQVEIAGRYAGYMGRMEADIAAFRRDESLSLPPGLDYCRIGGLSSEMRERMAAVRPATLGQAARLPGVTPAALQALLAHVRRHAA